MTKSLLSLNLFKERISFTYRKKEHFETVWGMAATICFILIMFGYSLPLAAKMISGELESLNVDILQQSV